MSSDIKKNMTDEERISLAAKLDRELEEFIDGLEKKRYSEGWPEDRWEEEMDKHPFFMKKAPAPGEELSPLMVGLQELKFDPENNTPEELAQKYKDDGNFEFKHKNYRLAIINFSEGIKAKCENDELNATLYNNRSASHFYLKNFRSSLNDCLVALKLKPNYLKARKRAIDCCFELKEFEQCIKHCDSYLENSNNHDILKIRIKAIETRTKLERDKRKESILNKKNELLLENTLNIINGRKIKVFDKKIFCGDLKHIPKPSYEPLLNHAICLKDDILHWPVLFLYPEFSTSDCLQSVSESLTLNDCLEEIFADKPSWDTQNIYKPNNLNVYFENRNLSKMLLLDKNKKIQDICTQQNFIVYDGVLSFYVVPKETTIEETFIKQKLVKQM